MTIIDKTTGEQIVPSLVDEFSIGVMFKNSESIAHCTAQAEIRGECRQLFADDARCAFSFTNTRGDCERVLRLCQIEIIEQ